jgi:hypothetical protein
MLLLYAALAAAQGTPPSLPDPSGPDQGSGTPPWPVNHDLKQRVTILVHKEINRTMYERTSPSIDAWQPLTTMQKYQRFLDYTYSPWNFAGAGVNALLDEMDENHQYEKGFSGLGQRYGIELATGETSAFFGRFLIPALLKQDPRYFRNPKLPLRRRILYSISRVVITRNDRGGQTLNASYIAGNAISQELADLYVPGQRQGLQPIAGRLTFNLARDAGFNLLNEFWPEIRRKLLHR